MQVNKFLVSALLCVALTAPALGQNLRLTKRQLRQENARLRMQLDSLRIDLEKYRSDSRLNDSIVSELRDIYENNAQRSAAGLNPEDYTPEITDSLLSIWYLHRQIGRSNEGQEYDMDSVHFESNVPDKVYIERLEAMNSFITLPFNETVRNYIILYSEKMPNKMGHILGLCRYYMPIFEEVFNKYDMPLELKYMAVIESALNPALASALITAWKSTPTWMSAWIRWPLPMQPPASCPIPMPFSETGTWPSRPTTAEPET